MLFFKKYGIKTPNFASFNKDKDLYRIIEKSKIKFPLIIKTNTLGYDGKGQYRINSSNDVDKILTSLEKDQDYIIEELVNFKKEFSVIIGKDLSGNSIFFNPIENIHKKILHGIKPNIVFILKVSKETSRNRLIKRKTKNRYDNFSQSFYNKAQKSFINIGSCLRMYL